MLKQHILSLFFSPVNTGHAIDKSSVSYFPHSRTRYFSSFVRPCSKYILRPCIKSDSKTRAWKLCSCFMMWGRMFSLKGFVTNMFHYTQNDICYNRILTFLNVCSWPVFQPWSRPALVYSASISVDLSPALLDNEQRMLNSTYHSWDVDGCYQVDLWVPWRHISTKHKSLGR